MKHIPKRYIMTGVLGRGHWGKNRYLDCARRQAELESEVKGLEQEVKVTEEQIREGTKRLAAVEQQVRK